MAIDKFFYNLILQEESRNSSYLHLTINENRLSQCARSILYSPLGDRYFFGGGHAEVVDFESFTFLGLQNVDEIVSISKVTLQNLLQCKGVFLNAYSGIHAMMASLLFFSSPGQTFVSINPEDGGHAMTRSVIESIGRKHIYASCHPITRKLDIRETASIIEKHSASIFYVDFSTYTHYSDLSLLRELVPDRVILIYDASHSLGFLVGRTIDNPLCHGFNVITANTHKTFPGPQRGILAFADEEVAEKFNFFACTSLVSSVHTATLMCLCICIEEMRLFGNAYTNRIIANSKALAIALHNRGVSVRHSIEGGTFTENEQLHLFVDEFGERSTVYHRLVSNGISANFQKILGGRPFARLGTQEISRCGVAPDHMELIADFVLRSARGEKVKEEVLEFSSSFPNIYYSFDHGLA